MSDRSAQQGVGLIEVLVALVIVLVSVLGTVALSVKTVQQESESYQRVQALALLQDMVERINANRKVASCYSNSGTGYVMGTGAANTYSCGAGTAAQRAQAVADLTEWDEHLNGSLEQKSADDSNVGAVIGAIGCIKYESATSLYRVTVAWQGLAATVAPKSTSTCGQGSFGTDDKLRRTVNAVVRLADLTAP